MGIRSSFANVLKDLQVYFLGALLLLLAAIIIVLLSPFALLLFIQKLLFPPKRIRFSASEAADLIEKFLNGEGMPWDWDDFTSVPTDHPDLERIRKKAASVDLPLTPDGETQLRDLLEEARRVAERDPF